MRKFILLLPLLAILVGCGTIASGVSSLYKSAVDIGCTGLKAGRLTEGEYAQIRDTFGKPVRVEVHGDITTEEYRKGYTTAFVRKEGEEVYLVTCVQDRR